MMLPSSNQNIMVRILYEIDSVVQESVLAVVYNIRFAFVTAKYPQTYYRKIERSIAQSLPIYLV